MGAMKAARGADGSVVEPRRLIDLALLTETFAPRTEPCGEGGHMRNSGEPSDRRGVGPKESVIGVLT
jgi:hypothetical protein